MISVRDVMTGFSYASVLADSLYRRIRHGVLRVLHEPKSHTTGENDLKIDGTTANIIQITGFP